MCLGAYKYIMSSSVESTSVPSGIYGLVYMCCPQSTFFCFQFKLNREVKHHLAILHCCPDLKQEYTTEKKQRSSSFQTNGKPVGDGLVKFLLSESENKLKNNCFFWMCKTAQVCIVIGRIVEPFFVNEYLD